MNVRLFVALIVVSAIVAYVADYLGKRLGRRRVSLLGIRPRTTAVMIATGSGVVITMLTMGALAVASHDVRDALFRIQKIYSERDAAIAQRDAAVREEHQARSALEAARRELSAAEQSRTDAIAAQQTALRQRDVARTDLEKTRADLLMQRRRLEEQRKALVQALHQSQILESQRRKLEADLAQLDQQLKKVSGDLAEVDRELGIRNVVLGITDPAAPGRTIVEAGQQLARVTLQADSSDTEVQDAVGQLLEATEREATRRGAAPFPGEAQRAILLYPIQVQRMSLEEMTAQLIQTVRKLSGEVVMIAFARYGAREGVPVVVDLAVQEVRPVLGAGTVLVQRDFDGTQDFDTLAAGLRQMLLDLRTEALRQGMIPPPGGTFGELPISRVVELIHAIQRAGARAVVRGTVTEDARNIDPLTVEFEVAPQAKERMTNDQ